MADFLPALELARRFHGEAVAPVIAARWPELAYAALLAGDGSEVLGFDDDVSTDHDWGPRLQVILSPDAFAAHAADLAYVLDAALPETFLGWPVRFTDRDRARHADLASGAVGGPHGVEIFTPEGWTRRVLGTGAEGPVAAVDWLALPEQRLLAATAGAVFRDDDGALTTLRRHLSRPPEDVRLYRLASQWARIAEESAFVGRAGARGDDLGSRLIAARLVRDVMAIGFLVEGVYAPYAKWFGTAFAALPCAAELCPALERALAADNWKGREAALAEACLAAARICAADGRVGLYHARPFQVINADEIAEAIRARIADAELRARPLTGAIDQVSDSTLVVSSPERSRAVIGALR